MANEKDPVADKSTFLCMYMSNHPDTLVAYVRYFGKVKERVVSAQMKSIDSNAMTLAYKVHDGGDAKKEVRIEFDPPLSGYEEVKPRLLGMTADAQESLGMTKTPQVTSFELPLGFLQAGLPLALLIYTSLSPYYAGPVWSLGHFLYSTFGGYKVFKWIWIAAVSIHCLETLYVQRLAVKHRMGPIVGSLYVLSTFFFGYTIVSPLRKKIQTARIDSIMKGK